MKEQQERKLPSATQMFYSELETEFLEEIRLKGGSTQDFKNLRNALRSWRAALGLKKEDPVGQEMGELFSQSLATFRGKQAEMNIKKTTYSPRASRIKAIRVFYLEHRGSAAPALPLQPALPARFADRLKFVLDSNGFTPCGFARTRMKGKINALTMLNWTQGKSMPSSRYYQFVKEIETSLNLPPDTLISTLPRLKNPAPPEKKIAYRAEQGKKCQQKYATLTEEVKKELRELSEYKSVAVLPESLKRTKQGVWTLDEKNQLPTARITSIKLGYFLGFCHLPENASDLAFSGLGMKKKQLTMALLTDKQIVEKYITIFLKVRSRGRFHQGHLSFLMLATCLLRKETGYLYQKPEMARKLGLRLTPKQWQKRCLDARRRLIEIQQAIELAKKNGSDEYGYGRDPKAPIREILELENPLIVTAQMLTEMLADVEKLCTSPKTKAALYRDFLLLSLLQANPLRAKMFSIMKLNKNLVKKSDGSWWIHFDRRNFKNRQSLKEDYAVKVASSLWAVIERYLNEFRPMLLGSESNDCVFIITRKKQMANKSMEMTVEDLRNITTRATKKYIPNCVGFGPHAFRHIVATGIIKSNQALGFYLAAEVLRDKVETVKANYAHLKTSEMFEPYNRFFDSIWATVGLGPDKNGKNDSSTGEEK